MFRPRAKSSRDTSRGLSTVCIWKRPGEAVKEVSERLKKELEGLRDDMTRKKAQPLPFNPDVPNLLWEERLSKVS